MRIDSNRLAAVSVRDLERALGRPPRAALSVDDRVTVVPLAGGMNRMRNRLPSLESQTVDPPSPLAVSRLEVPFEDSFDERVPCARP